MLYNHCIKISAGLRRDFQVQAICGIFDLKRMSGPSIPAAGYANRYTFIEHPEPI